MLDKLKNIDWKIGGIVFVCTYSKSSQFATFQKFIVQIVQIQNFEMSRKRCEN